MSGTRVWGLARSILWVGSTCAGMTCARAVSLHRRSTRVAVVPEEPPGGGAVMFNAMR